MRYLGRRHRHVLFFLADEPMEPGSLKRSTGTSVILTVEPHSILDRRRLLLPSAAVGPQIRPQFCHEHTTATLVRPRYFSGSLHLDRPPDLHASTSVQRSVMRTKVVRCTVMQTA
ncbi:hypothetical protein BDA96_01G462900 [Sorghum bicolor]|uniref:Uncharacterized protein n=2 Tax=Sorghum bicolor TaxID=4558 RepID=A0A1Z5SAF2_SORBI|nr:hypothetical protein BDA96_01G462900 [Sorghum bicolor]OQU92902.1 hypothetical protein SORBI_3001G434650 [Sorghum bicolor]OQU92903.1 hypothetical protein SORBI_3001G434650 [Sorghum bicolor]